MAIKMVTKMAVIVMEVSIGSITEIIANITEVMTAVMVAAVITIEIMTAETEVAIDIITIMEAGEKVLVEVSVTIRIITVIITSIEMVATRGRLQITTNQIIIGIIFIAEIVVDDKNLSEFFSQIQTYFIELPLPKI